MTLRQTARSTWRQRVRAAAASGAALIALTLGLVACASGQTSSSQQLALPQVPWCDQPSINFQDDGKLTPSTLTDWNAVQHQLGFTPYLPSSMPKGTCLALAGGSVHDPIFGGRFLITYYLPGSGPLSFSEAPRNVNAGGTLSGPVQCSQSTFGGTPTAASATSTAASTAGATPAASSTAVAPLTICLGTVSETNISVAAAMSTHDLQALFKGLKPNIDWVPTVPKTTSTATSKA